MKRLLCLFLCLLVLPCQGARWRVWSNATVAFATFSDNFTRTNASPVSNPASSGGTWTNNPGASAACSIVSNFGIGTTSLESGLRVLTPTFTGQHSATVKVQDTTAAFYGPAVRIQGTSNYSCYEVNMQGNTTSLMIRKCTDTGTLAFLQLGSTITGLSLTAGDLIKMEVSGTSTVTLNVYVNGSLVGTATDSTSPFTGGQPGVFAYGPASFSNFSATDF